MEDLTFMEDLAQTAANFAQTMPDINSSKITATKLGFFDHLPEIRKRIYQFSLLSHDIDPRTRDVYPLMVLETGLHAPSQDLLAISPRPLSAQLLRTCHQVFKETWYILYTENNFTLELRERVRTPRVMPIKITSGSLGTLPFIIISIDTLGTMSSDLHTFVNCLPSLQVLGIQGELIIETGHEGLLHAPDKIAQKGRRQAVVNLIEAFNGLDMLRGFLIQHIHLGLEYRFGVAADITLFGGREVIRVPPEEQRVNSIKYRGNELTNRTNSG
jgi:hypothetical protein